MRRGAAGTAHRGRVASCAGALPREISRRDLRDDSGEILRRPGQGETFVVTRNGVPVGELTPYRRRRFVAADAAVATFRTAAPAVDGGTFRADLDAVAGQDAGRLRGAPASR